MLAFMKRLLFHALIILVACFAFMFGLGKGGAAELIMFGHEGCHWCEVWGEDVGVIYHKTPAGKLAPLRRVDLHGPLPEDLKSLKHPAFSPTFIVVEKGVEMGRIIGYPGEDFFWGQLEKILKKVQTEKNVQTKVY